MESIHFQTEVSRSLGQLEAGVEGICSRLDVLNGSVARHELRIGSLEAKGFAMDAREQANRTWRDNLTPFVKLFLSFLLGLILRSAPDVLKFILPK